MLIRVRPKPDQPDRLLQPVFMFLLLFRPIGQMGYITHTFMVSMCSVQTGLLWSIEHWYHPEEGLGTRWKCQKRMSCTVQWDGYFASKYFPLYFSGSHSELSFSLRLSPSPFGRLTPLMHLLCLITTKASVMRFIFSAMLSEW